jgi:hypothetical protein
MGPWHVSQPIRLACRRPDTLCRQILDRCLASWKQHGTAALEQLRVDDNKAYCELMAGPLPKNLMLDATAEPSPLDGMTPEELQRLLELVRLAKAKTIDNCET